MSEWNYKPTPRDCEYITKWLDEFVDLCEKDHNEKKQRKKHKPKHTQPFWTNNWRKK